MLTDDRVLLWTDSERHVLVGNAPHDVVERWSLGINQLHGVRHNRAGQGFALLARCLVALIEHPQQLRMRIEHAWIEVRGDLIGMRRDDRCSCLHHVQ